MQWETVKPVLFAAYAFLDIKETTTCSEVCALLSKEEEDPEVGRALTELTRNRFLDGQPTWQDPVPLRVWATEKGLQQTSGWPKPGEAGPDQVELLLRVLDERINSEDTPEETKSKLLPIRRGIVDASRDIMVRVLSDYASRASGLG